MANNNDERDPLEAALRDVATAISGANLSAGNTAKVVENINAHFADGDRLSAEMDSIRIRSSECAEKAGKKVFPSKSLSWQDQIDINNPEVRQYVVKTMQDIGYVASDEIWSGDVDPEALQDIKNLYVFKKWLDTNKKQSNTGPFAKQHDEMTALLYMHASFVADGLGIEHSNSTERMRQAGFFKHIQPPSQQSSRFH